MILTIITINYNNADGLKKTMNSVINQSFTEFEYIIIDGNSTDSSIEIIKSYDFANLNWISENDNGIYNAMNKGIKKANGKYLLFLNSGDILADNNVLSLISPKINNNYSFVGCNILLDYHYKKELREHPEKISFSYLVSKSIFHPSTFIKKEMFDLYGMYNENNKIISDWEFFFKTVALNGESFQKISEILTVFNMEGISSDINNSALVKEEKNSVFQKHLKSIHNSNLDLFLFEQFKSPTKRIKYLKKIDKSPLIRKITTVILSFLSLFISKSN